MRRSLEVAVLSVVFSSVAGCASLRVGSDYDRDVSFAARETYDWVEVEEGEDDQAAIGRLNPFIDRRLRRAVDSELAARGYVKSEEGPVDLLVAVDVLEPEDAGRYTAQQVAFPLLLGLSIGFGPGFYYPGFGYGYGRYGFGSGRYGRFGGYGPYAFRPFGSYRPYFGYAYGYRSFGPYGFYGGGRRGDLESLAPGTFIVDILDGETGELVWRGWANGALAHAPDVDRLPEFIEAVVREIMEDFPPDES